MFVSSVCSPCLRLEPVAEFLLKVLFFVSFDYCCRFMGPGKNVCKNVIFYEPNFCCVDSNSLDFALKAAISLLLFSRMFLRFALSTASKLARC